MANSNKKKTAALSAIDQKILEATGEEAFFDSKKARAKKARQQNERDFLNKKRAKYEERKAGQKGRIVSQKDVVAARNQVLVKYIAACLDLNFEGAIDGRLRFTRTHQVFDNKAEVVGILKSSGDTIKADFQIFYSAGDDEEDDRGDRHVSGPIEANSVNDLIDAYAAFIFESQPVKDKFSEEDEDADTGAFAAYILKRLRKIDKGKALERAMKGIKLPPEKLSKIQRYVMSRTKGSHQESKEESAVKPEMKSLYEKIVASTGGEFTEELALAVKKEGLIYNCLMGLFGRGNFRYEKSAIKGKKTGRKKATASDKSAAAQRKIEHEIIAKVHAFLKKEVGFERGSYYLERVLSLDRKTTKATLKNFSVKIRGKDALLGTIKCRAGKIQFE